jgi:16S rRNA (uracil1498-N3)-methyltransferase
VVERPDSTAVNGAGGARFFAPDLRAGARVHLSSEDAHHARVLRLAPGARVTLLDGAGRVASGVIDTLGRNEAAVQVESVEMLPPPPAVHLIVPVADRDRMLWLAEKAVELGATSWRPVRWQRSNSVAPRGEGDAFERKLRARMLAALTQSGGAWLPEIQPLAVGRWQLANSGLSLLLDRQGEQILDLLHPPARLPVTIVLGPEGGLETEEQQMLVDAGFLRASLAPTILRFETAGVAALAVTRAALARAQR